MKDSIKHKRFNSVTDELFSSYRKVPIHSTEMADISAILDNLTSTSQPGLTSTDPTNITGNGLNVTSTTDSSDGAKKDLNVLLQQIFDVSLIVCVCITMCALGCTMERKTLKDNLRRPTGILIGLVCQFIAFPAVTFGLAHALQLSKWNAIGMILLGTSPGGSASNLFTYYCQGEVTLR